MATTVTLKPNAIDISGSTSGTTTLQATAVAGTTTLTLPAATDTLVGKATTDTLTNKTLTTPSVSSPTISDGTANGVAYLNGSKVLTTGSALTFDGSAFAVTGALSATTSITSIGSVGNVFTDSTGARLNFSRGADNYFPASTAGGYFAWIVNNSGSNAMTLDVSGNLGIVATSIPSYTKLAVTGTAGAQTDAKQQITISAPTTTVGEGAGIRINAASGAKEAIGVIGAVNNASGNLGSMTFGVYNGGATVPEWMRISNAGIVTMSAYSAGTATFSAAGVISSVSDETWKIKDGVPVDPDSMLKKLEPGYWFYNDEKKEIFGVDRQLGFYAQNVNSAIGPEAAPEPEEGKPWGYYDRSVLAVTVMSLQKALATIETLTARITALESA